MPMEMEEYLAFVDYVGLTVDRKYIYRFDYTVDTEIVWGDFFNVTPSAIVPDIQPDKNTLSHTCKVIFPSRMAIAKKNFCFSMQDCIDGIMPLMFSEIGEDELEYKSAPLFFNFGEPMESVTEKLNSFKEIEVFDMEEVEKGDDSAIDDLIEAMDNNIENDEE